MSIVMDKMQSFFLADLSLARHREASFADPMAVAGSHALRGLPPMGLAGAGDVETTV